MKKITKLSTTKHIKITTAIILKKYICGALRETKSKANINNKKFY